MDWLSRLLDMIPVRGHLDLRCFYGAPWRIAQDRGAAGEIPYHVVLGGSAVLEDPAGGPSRRLTAGSILLLPHGSAHILHDGSGVPAAPAQERASLNLTISENAGTGDRLDMLCGRFVLTPPHDRLLWRYLPPRLVVQAADHSASTVPAGTGAQLAGLVSLMRIESAVDSLGGRAMLNALSTAMFALTLRLASRSGGSAARAAGSRWSSTLGARLGGNVQSARPPVDAARAGAPLPYVAGNPGAPFPGEIGTVCLRPADGYPHDPGGNELRKPSISTGAVAEAVGYRVRGRLPARLQATHGHDAGAVAPCGAN